MCYCDVSMDHYTFQTQTLEESESQYHIAAQDLAHQHMLVVYLQHFNGVLRRKDHRQRSASTPTGQSAKKNSSHGSARRRLAERQLIVVLTELVAQGFHFYFPEMHLFCYLYDATFEALEADAFVRTVVSWLRGLLLVGFRDLGILELQRRSGLHLVPRTKQRTNAGNFIKKLFF